MSATAGEAGGRADEVLEFALPAIRLARQRARNLWLRIDTRLPAPAVLQGVETDGVRYVARVRTNQELERKAASHLTRPRG